ncbi:MAG: DUF4097 domain-containing protein [Ruminococcaceae bacterium]|nr:DUF4097 domain-containing protein [Oscillospiraceae bacterium]
MTAFQKGIKYLAIGLAVFLTVSIIGGILGAIGIFGDLFDDEVVLEDLTSYPVTGQIRNLEIVINAADFSIKKGKSFSVESNLKHIQVEEKGSTLSIEETRKFSGTYADAVLILYIPAETEFDNVELTTGAGRLTIEDLSVETIDFELGTGEVNITSLTATRSAEIDGGAGRITVSGGALNDLDLGMGVGQLNLTSALSGNCRMDLGIGASDITLIGSKEDYKLEVNKGIGDLSVDGQSVNDYGSSGNGANEVEINGGIGAIRIRFLMK